MLLGQKLQNSLKQHGLKQQYSNHFMGNKVNYNNRRVLIVPNHKPVIKSSLLEKK